MEKQSPKLKSQRRRLCARAEGYAWIGFVLLSLFFGIYMTSKAVAEPLPQTEGGQFYLHDSEGRYHAAVHLESSAKISINGMIAKVELSQQFSNTSDTWLEGVYVFPLAETAAVNHMQMHIGERVIVGEIKEKNAARKIYEQAKSEGKKAALVEQQRPNLFTQKVANIPPGESITVTLRYLQRVDYDQGTFSLRLPTTLTPRYMPGLPLAEQAEQIEEVVRINTLGWALPTGEVPDADLISPFMTTSAGAHNSIAISVELNAGLPLADIKALYHELRIAKNKQIHNIHLQNGREKMDRDFVLHWRPANSKVAQAAAFRENIDNEDYLLVMLVPPQQPLHTQPYYLPRDMIFVIDTSGSMQGTSIIQARESLALAVARLRPEDNFNVIEFNSTHTSLFHHPQSADTHNIQQAINWVSRLQADGGTEMHSALQAALSQMDQSARLQQIVFITDGAVGNEAALFELIHQYLGVSRLFTVGIGSAPNSYFMRKAAEFGRGSFTHIGSTTEVKARMEALFSKLESAVVSHINIQWPVAVESYPQKVPDLYAGEPILLAAKTPTARGKLQLDGFTADAAWSTTLDLDIPQNSFGVASIWARAKVDMLEDQRFRGMLAEEVREAVLDVALQHKLLTAYTSFVAVEQLVSRTNENTLVQNAIPNLVANGQVPQTQTLAYPQGATSAELTFILGFIGIIVWCIYILILRIHAR